MLDTLYSDYEDYLNGKLDYVTVLMNDMINYLNSNGANIQAGLSEIKSEYGLTTLYFEDFGSTADSILSTFNNGDFANKLTNISSIIENFKDTMTKVTETSTNGVIKAIEANSVDIKVNNDGTVSISSKGQTATVGGSGGSGSGKTDSKSTTNGGSKSSSGKAGTWRGNWTDGWWYEHTDGTYTKDGSEVIDGKTYYFDSKGYMLADQYADGHFLGKDGAWDGGALSSWKSNSNGWWYESTDGKYITGNWALIDGDWYYFDGSGYMVTGKRTINGKSYTFGSDGKWKGYAKGIRRVPENQMAWTQEDKSELIFRSSDGAMLTPLGRGDMVFTNEMSQRLWDFAKGNIGASLDFNPKIGGITPQSITSNNSISINLPNVKNYDEFKQAMKNDSELEQFLQEVTIGQVMGNNKLRKNRL